MRGTTERRSGSRRISPERWEPFTDRELHRLYARLVAGEDDDRSAARMAEEIVVQADQRGPYRAKYIVEHDQTTLNA
ncbi:MAG TPA: hypothetical protein VF533_25235 [Solirubrobacteraceae bacterium]